MDRLEYLRQWRERNLEKSRARTKAWYAKNKDRTYARARAWVAAHPERAKRYNAKYEAKQKIPCPYCSRRMDPLSRACIECLRTFGHMCVKNRNCGVQGRHKHCPYCFMPVLNPKSTYRLVEECALCLAEAERGAYMQRERAA